ncbi:MAG: hypothetical protein ABGY24_14645 [bacterium]
MASNAQDAVPGTLQQGLKDGWFTELSSMWPGQGMSFKVNEVVHTDRSDFQVRAVCSVRCAVCGVRLHVVRMAGMVWTCSDAEALVRVDLRGFAWDRGIQGWKMLAGVFVDTR